MNDLVILHLSDLHIDARGRIYSKLHGELLKDIKNQMFLVPDNRLVIVVTGDVINMGDPGAIDNAKSFFQKLKEITEKKTKAIYIVPGNHDKKRTSSDKILIPAYRELLGKSGEMAFDDKFKNDLWPLQHKSYEESGYLDLIKYVYDLFEMPDIEAVANTTFGVHILTVEEKRYCFILLNTAWSGFDQNDNRKLILGKFQLDELEMQMRSTIENYDTDPAAMTFVMGHHPIESLYGTEQDALFAQMVSYNNMCANIYLCGHEHDRKVVNWSNNRHAIHTLMTGFGWPETPSDHVHEHYYSLYIFNIDLNSMDIYVRRTNDGSQFIPDLSIYTGSSNQAPDKLVRPIVFEEAQGAIELSSATNVPLKRAYASSVFLNFSKWYQNALNEISIEAIEKIVVDKNIFFENYNRSENDKKMCSVENDELILNYLTTPENFSNFSKEQQEFIESVLKRNKNIIYETFQGFIQWLCQKFLKSLVGQLNQNQIIRFHFRFLADKTTSTYSTLCSSFSFDEQNDEDSHRPNDIKYCDLIEAAFTSPTSGTLIYSVNQNICQNKLKKKWHDFITVVPDFPANIYSRKVNKHTVKTFPLITFGVTINSCEHELLLHCMDYYRIDTYLSNLIQLYTDVFKLDIDDFITWIKVQDKQEA